jgi:hypothetical protein
MKVLKESFPYRFVENQTASAGWIEKFNGLTRRWFKMYECDSPLQLLTAMDDINYVKWLDPEGVPCYREGRGDSVKSPYNK